MKLYTEEQTIQIATDIAEKLVSNNIDSEMIRYLFDYYGDYSKLELDLTDDLKDSMDDDGVREIEIIKVLIKM